MKMSEKAKVKVIFTALKPDGPSWPYVGYNYDKRAKELMGVLRQGLPNFELSDSVISSKEEVDKALKGNYDGYLVYMIGAMWQGIAEAVLDKEFPTVLADDLYAGSGGFLQAHAYAKKKNLPMIGVSSSNIQDVIDAVKLFYPIARMKKTKILVVRDGDITPAIKKTKEIFGTELLRIDAKEVDSYYDSVDPKEAEKWRDKWIDEAEKVVEPSAEELLKSAKMYLAMKKIVAEKEAEAITMSCLGLYYGGKIKAYPCLGFFQLNNDGLTGVCEADVNSTLTQVMVRYLTGRPGFVSDPVIDTASDQIIYAHCVCTNRPFGPDGLPNPYIIRSHTEDQQGASVQSIMPLGEIVTTTGMSISQDAMAVHQGCTVSNVHEDKACRTKLAAETDAEKILNNWNIKFSFGWHRVTFYGDLRREVKNLCTLLKLELVEEDM
jgi:L-fucose isomerase-like protein